MSTRLAGEYSSAGISGPVKLLQAGPAAWCVTEGRLEGVPELAADLGVDVGAPDEAVLGAAFVELREQMLGRLGGSFALLAWDGNAQEGLLAVDPLGSRSLFFHADAGAGLHFATEVLDLLELLPAEPGPNERAVARWLAYGTLEPDETLFEGVRRLSGGRHLRLAGGRWSEHRHWQPLFASSSATPDEAAAAIRKRLEQSISERCGGRSAGIFISGGVDSTSVAAVAAKSRPGPSSLRAYSAIFPDDPAIDESEFVDVAVTALGLPSCRLAVRPASVLMASADHVQEWRLPAATPNLFFQRSLLELSRTDGTEIVLDGQGGDELFGCSPFLLADLLRCMRLGSVRTRSRELAGGDASLAREYVRTYAMHGAAPAWLHAARSRLRRRPAPHWLTPNAAELAGDRPGRWAWVRLDGPRWWAWLADTLTTGRERMGVHDHLRRRHASERVGGAHPLLDDLGLIELVLQLPPELAYDLELDRPVLRRAMRGLVPESIRLRSTKSFFNTLLVDSLSGPDRPMLTSLLQPRGAEIRTYVTDKRLRGVVNGPTAEDHPHLWARNAWRLASTELWLQSLGSAQAPRSRSAEPVPV